jgi:hypothetical protein
MSTSSNPDAPAGRVDRLRLDYQQTTDLMRQITDVRFKLSRSSRRSAARPSRSSDARARQVSCLRSVCSG